jgi:hypothetical protein
MTKPSNFTNFVDALTDELLAIPDEQVLEGTDSAAVQTKAQALLKAARAEAGRRRLAAAKVGAAALKSAASTAPASGGSVPLDEARRFIAQAQNDPRYTLAARKLGEMPDDEVLRLYWQMKQLEQSSKPDEDDNA